MKKATSRWYYFMPLKLALKIYVSQCIAFAEKDILYAVSWSVKLTKIPRSRSQQIFFPWVLSPWFADSCRVTVSSHGPAFCLCVPTPGVSSSVHENTSPIGSGLPWPHLKLITSSKAYHQIHWWLQLQHVNFFSLLLLQGTHLIHNKYFLFYWPWGPFLRSAILSVLSFSYLVFSFSLIDWLFFIHFAYLSFVKYVYHECLFFLVCGLPFTPECCLLINRHF